MATSDEKRLRELRELDSATGDLTDYGRHRRIQLALELLPVLLDAAAERDSLRAEVARLREALTDLRAWGEKYTGSIRGMGATLYPDPILTPSAAKELVRRAAAALAGDADGG